MLTGIKRWTRLNLFPSRPRVRSLQVCIYTPSDLEEWCSSGSWAVWQSKMHRTELSSRQQPDSRIPEGRRRILAEVETWAARTRMGWAVSARERTCPWGNDRGKGSNHEASESINDVRICVILSCPLTQGVNHWLARWRKFNASQLQITLPRLAQFLLRKRAFTILYAPWLTGYCINLE